MTAIGGWNDPEACDGFRSALTCVHENAHGRKGDYIEECTACFDIWKEKGAGSCSTHIAEAAPRRRGNVCNSTVVRDTIKQIKTNSSHKREGAAQLLPGDVRDIGEYCINSNDPFLFAVFVLLLVSIDLFLRKMEFMSLELSNFNTNLFVMSGEYIIEALNLKVKGKKKKKKRRGMYIL